MCVLWRYTEVCTCVLWHGSSQHTTQLNELCSRCSECSGEFASLEYYEYVMFIVLFYDQYPCVGVWLYSIVLEYTCFV